MRSHYQKFDFFDGLAILQANDYKQSFPLHRHDVFSLTLVRSGTETTVVQGRELLTPAGAISLTPPERLHANPNRNGGTYDFTTFYLSPDLMTYLNGGISFVPEAVIINDSVLFEALLEWPQRKTCPQSLTDLLKQGLVDRLEVTQTAPSNRQHNEKLGHVLQFIEANLADKIALKDLATIAGLSPHHFLRWFRSMKGITPLQYVNLRRIEQAREALVAGTPLIEVAHALGFYDQSHFHRFFLRYAGVTPGTFMKGSNIVQD